MTRPDPRSFGRRRLPATQEQIEARAVCAGCVLLFICALAVGLKTDNAGASCVLVMIAFLALILATAAAGEA